MMSSNKRKDKKGRVLKKGESQKQDNLYMYRWTDHNRTRQCCYASTLEKLREKEKEIEKELMLYKKLSDGGYSAGTIQILQKIIRSSLQLACDDNVILKNPADGCTKDYSTELEKLENLRSKIG